MKTQMPENLVKDAVKDYLDYTGWYHFPIWQGFYSKKGISDRIAMKDGIVLFIECKKPKGQQSDDQKRFQVDVEFHKCHYVLVQNVQDLIDYIEGIKLES